MTKSGVSVCFRFDDPAARSDHELESRVLELFAKYRVKLTIAVVPFRVERGEIIALVKSDVPHLVGAQQNGSAEIALHGYCHEPSRLDETDVPSEFCGVDFDVQWRLIEEGKQVLEKVFSAEITGFVPPWNTYDPATLRAVDQAGLQYLSAGIGEGEGDILSRPLVVPKTSSARIEEAKRSISSALRYSACCPTLVIVFHPDNFVEFRSPPSPGEQKPFLSLVSLEELLSLVASHPSEIRSLTLAELVHSLKGAKQVWTGRRFDGIRRFSHRLGGKMPTGFLSTASWYKLML